MSYVTGFYDEVIGAPTAFENEMIADQAWIERSAKSLLAQDQTAMATELITQSKGEGGAVKLLKTMRWPSAGSGNPTIKRINVTKLLRSLF